jgi:hypothetical protein
VALSANTAPPAPEKDEEVAADDLEFSFSVPKEATQDLHHAFPYKEKIREVAAHDSEFSFPALKDDEVAANDSEFSFPAVAKEASDDFTFPVLHPH